MATAPTATDILTIITNILQGATEHEALINTIAGGAGILPEVSLAEKALPAIVAVLQVLEQGGAVSPLAALQALFNHITPGQPNSPILTDLPPGS